MAKHKVKRGGKRNGAGRPMAYPGDGRAVRVSFSAPPGLAARLDTAADQIGKSRSAIVVAGLEQILSQSPDRLAAQIGR